VLEILVYWSFESSMSSVLLEDKQCFGGGLVSMSWPSGLMCPGLARGLYKTPSNDGRNNEEQSYPYPWSSSRRSASESRSPVSLGGDALSTCSHLGVAHRQPQVVTVALAALVDSNLRHLGLVREGSWVVSPGNLVPISHLVVL
jgi:hypothetical protein